MKKTIITLVAIIIATTALIYAFNNNAETNTKTHFESGSLLRADITSAHVESNKDDANIDEMALAHLERTKRDENLWRTLDGHLDSDHRFYGTYREIRVVSGMNPGVRVHYVCTDGTMFHTEGYITYTGDFWSGVYHIEGLGS